MCVFFCYRSPQCENDGLCARENRRRCSSILHRWCQSFDWWHVFLEVDGKTLRHWFDSINIPIYCIYNLCLYLYIVSSFRVVFGTFIIPFYMFMFFIIQCMCLSDLECVLEMKLQSIITFHPTLPSSLWIIPCLCVSLHHYQCLLISWPPPLFLCVLLLLM